MLLNYTGNTVENKSLTLFNIGIKQDLSMLTEGLNIEATGSWDSQSLYGESRYSMPFFGTPRDNRCGRKAVLRRPPLAAETPFFMRRSSSRRSSYAFHGEFMKVRRIFSGGVFPWQRN
ncbi:hypothetical protein [Pyramidobacter piscolens]|uniref:hypothetical protein n=1 Tax=Pyramidobacter piscolens TaxID=638849 RepID=UPI003AB8D92F